MHELAYNVVEAFKLVAAVAGWLAIIDLIHFIFNRDREDRWSEIWDQPENSKDILSLIKWALIGMAGTATGIINFLTHSIQRIATIHDVDLFYQLVIWGCLSSALVIHWTNRSSKPFRVFAAFLLLTCFSTFVSSC